MKLVCNVLLNNRQLSNTASNSRRNSNRHIKSTLALCKLPKEDNGYCLLLFNNQNESGKKYKIKDNIKMVITKFINEGKVTIQFKEPAHDLFVQVLQSDIIQLKSFLHLLKKVVQGAVTEKELSRLYSTMSVTPVKNKDRAVTKLVICKRSDYPIHGFPRTLETLSINGIKRSQLDKGILQLSFLKFLDLSNNEIESLPEEISKLSLKELKLSHNFLGRGSPSSWKWLISSNLSKSLLLLDLSHNFLRFLPNSILKLHKLTFLYVNDNQLRYLPSGVGNLRNLKLVDCSQNEIKTLPGSCLKWRLDKFIINNNRFVMQFTPQANNLGSTKPLPICTLREYSGRKVLWARLQYPPGSLPATVIEFLDSAKFCPCGKAVWSNFIQIANNIRLDSLANEFVSNGSGFVPVDYYFCSLRCLYSSPFMGRSRQRVI